MGERIKKLRKELGLTQKEFAERIGIKSNTIATYEIGRNNPIDAVINLICREFNVNEAWLRTGAGGDKAMFLQRTEEDELSAAVERLITGESAEFKRRMILALSTMKDEHWLLLEQKLKEITGTKGSSLDTTGQERTDKEIEGQVDLYRRSLHSEKEPDTPVSSAKESGVV